MKWEKRNEWFPPGYEYDREIRMIVVWLIASIVYSLRYLTCYYGEYQDLFIYVNVSGVPQRILAEGRKIAPFRDILGYHLYGLVIAVIFLLVFAVLHYCYYFQDSRSIFLVRRLPDRWYVIRTCIVAPAVGILVSLLCMVSLWLIYYEVYMLMTPKECLS